MIELPDFATLAVARPSFRDAGFNQQGLGSLDRIDRKGSRYGVAFEYGPFRPDKGSIIVSRLIAARSEVLRVPFPLQQSQGNPGACVVDGAGQIGKTFNIRNVAPGYYCREGYWLSIETGGQHFLHNVKTGGQANAAGELTITLNELPRGVHLDGDRVHLAKPMVEGLIQGDAQDWELSAAHATSFSFVLEERR